MDESWVLLGVHLEYTCALIHTLSPQSLASVGKVDLKQESVLLYPYEINCHDILVCCDITCS